MKGRGFVKKFTRCENFNDAKQFAIDWYEDGIIEKKSHLLIKEQSFDTYSKKLQDNQKRLIRRGELDETMLYNATLKLDADVLPYLGHIHISKIDYTIVDDFIEHLYEEKQLSQSSLKKYVVLIRKVLREAERSGVIDYIPSLPTIKRTENPRPWLNPEQYAELLSACQDLRDNPPEGAGRTFDFGEMYDFIVFVTHSFLRPSEWKLLQNKYVRFLEDDGIEQLVLSVPNPKTITEKGVVDSTTTEIAADVYKDRILKRNPAKNDFLFFNSLKDRTYVADLVGRNFRVLV